MFRTLFKQALTEVSTTRKEALGAIREADGKFYKYVDFKNATATVAVVSGDPVAYFASTGYTNNRVVADCTDADGVPICAGFAVATVTGTAGTSYYIWIQISGSVTVPTTSGATIGHGVMLSTTDKTLSAATTVLNQAGIQQSTAGANNKVIAKCPF